jgi:hypothetical protein
MHIRTLFPLFRTIYMLYVISCTLNPDERSEISVSLNAQHDRERRQLIGSLHCNLWLLRCGRHRFECPHTCRSHLDRPPKLLWVRDSSVPGCCMCSSHTRLALGGTNCKNIYRMRHCLDWETLSRFLDEWFSPFAFLSYYPFGARDFCCQTNIQFDVLFIPIGKNLKVCSIPLHESVPIVDDEAGKEDTAEDGKWCWTGFVQRQQGPTSKQARWMQIVT